MILKKLLWTASQLIAETAFGWAVILWRFPHALQQVGRGVKDTGQPGRALQGRKGSSTVFGSAHRLVPLVFLSSPEKASGPQPASEQSWASACMSGEAKEEDNGGAACS